MKNNSGTTHQPACAPTPNRTTSRDAPPGGAAVARAHAKAVESLIIAFVLALLAQLGRPWRRPRPLPPFRIVPGQRHMPAGAPHAIAFALGLAPDWIFTPRNRGARAHARTASIVPQAAARDPP